MAGRARLRWNEGRSLWQAVGLLPGDATAGMTALARTGRRPATKLAACREVGARPAAFHGDFSDRFQASARLQRRSPIPHRVATPGPSTSSFTARPTSNLSHPAADLSPPAPSLFIGPVLPVELRPCRRPTPNSRGPEEGMIVTTVPVDDPVSVVSSRARVEATKRAEELNV